MYSCKVGHRKDRWDVAATPWHSLLVVGSAAFRVFDGIVARIDTRAADADLFPAAHLFGVDCSRTPLLDDCPGCRLLESLSEGVVTGCLNQLEQHCLQMYVNAPLQDVECQPRNASVTRPFAFSSGTEHETNSLAR